MNITLYDIALRFVGMAEVPGHESNPQILSMLRLDQKWPDGDEVPWCSAFINYCAWLLRLPRSKSLAAKSWLNVGTVVPFIEQARPGFDVVVLWRTDPTSASGHVGLYAGHGAAGVHLLGGNQGDRVSITQFPLPRIVGIRRLEE